MDYDQIRNAENVRHLYSEYPFPDGSASNELFISVIKREIGFFSKYIKPGMVVLDAGCGTGNYVAAFASIFPDATFIGIDFSQKSLEEAQAMFGQHPNLSGFSIKFIYIFIVSLHLAAGVGRGKGPVDGAALQVASVSPSQYFAAHP